MIHSIQVFYDQYVKPTIEHPIVVNTSMECVKFVAAGLFIELLQRKFLKETAEITRLAIISTTVVSPMLEEAVFRGILLTGVIRGAQWGWNYLRGIELTEKGKKVDQLFRIHLSAFVYAVCLMATLESQSTRANLIKFTWSYLGGVLYGHLTEKYQTLSLAILFHGINNILAAAGMIYPQHQSLVIAALVINRVGVALLVFTDVDIHIKHAAQLTISHVNNIYHLMMG